MRIHARLTIWYSTLLLLSLLLLGGGLYYELVIERNAAHARGRPGEPVEVEISEVVFYYAVPAVLVTLAGGWWLMRKALSPVSRLTTAAEHISAQNLRTHLPRTGNGDELDRLAEVFNAMLARLEGSFAREREFTLHASHELRTPLTIMRGQIETALREGGLAPDQHELLASQLGEIERLAAIVDGLFLLAKADAGLVEMKREPVALHQLVEDVFEDARMLGGAAKIEVSLDTMEPVAVNGDGRRLRQLLLALADNAIKFNRPGGAVRFRLARRGGEAELTISNTGDGIPAEVLPRVFDRFYRGDPARGSGADGSGLGLSIAQWIASAHGGTIQIASVPGGETTVAVRLPAG